MDPQLSSDLLRVQDVGSFFGTPLTYLIFVPLVGALIMMLIPKGSEAAHKVVALATSVVALGIGVYILQQFDYDAAQNAQFGVNLLTLALDGASLTPRAGA